MHTYQIQEFGLTERECYLLLGIYNGLLGDFAVSMHGRSLVANVVAAATESHLDREEYGYDLGLIDGDSPELEYEYHDLAEKLSAMPVEQAVAVEYFLYGFWAGKRRAPAQV